VVDQIKWTEHTEHRTQYSDGDHLNGDVQSGGVGRNRDSEPIYGSIACCERLERQVQYSVHSAVMNRGKLMTLVAGKRRSLLTAGDDEMYDKKPQRYAEDNGAAFNCTQR